MKKIKKIILKIILLTICILIASIFSIVIANTLNYIFTNNVEMIFKLNPTICIENLKSINEVKQIFLLVELAFMCLFLNSFFRIFDLKNFYAKTYKVTDNIEIPLPIGKRQTQNGSAWWLKEFKKNFDYNTIEYSNSTIQSIIKLAKENKQAISENKILTRTNTNLPCPFKKGGLVLGKKDKYKLKIYLKQYKHVKIPKLDIIECEEIYFIGDNLHSLTIGATRSGKTRNVVLPTIGNLALAGESMIMSDPKGELFEYSSEFLKNMGYNVLTLDFKNPLKSSKYNFLQPVINAVNLRDIPLAENRASDIVTSLVGEAKGEKIWNDGEKSVIKSAIMAVVIENKDNPEYQNLENVYHFIAKMCCEQDDKTMLVDKYLDSLLQTHSAVAGFAPARIASSKTRASFFTSALNTLNIFVDGYISTMMNSSDIDVEKIAKEKTALFLILPDEKVTFYSLCSLFVNQVYQNLVEIADIRGGQLEKRVNFILDEFGNFSAIPNFGGFLTVGGGRKIRFNLFIQSFAQLNDKYGDNVSQNILDNCYVWNYLKTSNDITAEKISKKIGTYTTATWSESNSSSGGSVNKSMSMNLTQRALLTTDEILRINRPYLLVMCSGKNPAITNSPDLSNWLFNDIMGLGSQEFNREVRQYVENNRPLNEVKERKIWNIADITKDLIKKEKISRSYD